MRRETIKQMFILSGGAAVLVALIAVFVWALIPRLQAKTEDYLRYSLEDLQTIPENFVLYREAAGVAVPAAHVSGICVLPSSGFAVSGDKSVFVFDERKKLIRTISLAAAAQCLAAVAGPGGNILLYVGMTDHIEVYASGGEKLDEWTSLGERAFITSIAASADMVYAADSGNKSIACFDHGGRLLRFIGDRADEHTFLIPGVCFDIALDSKGMLWAVDPGRLRVTMLSADGRIVRSWGKASPALEGFSGCCNPVHIAFLPGDVVVVQEKGLVRIKLYDTAGGFLGVAAGPAHFHETVWSLDLAAGRDGEVYALDTFLKKVRIFVRKDKDDEKKN